MPLLLMHGMLRRACGERPKPDRSFAESLCAWDTPGTQFRNAYTKYDEGQKRLDRLGLRLTQIQADSNGQQRPDVIDDALYCVRMYEEDRGTRWWCV